jgi:NAD(P)-dependent dehydrogenase (short-subunit alcohol dehydrogenase family)
MGLKNNALALVTGSTAGIGFSIAKKLLERDLSVIINGRTEERVNRAVQQLVSAGAGPSQLHGVAADVTTVSGANKIIEAFPEVDILINNFGAFQPKSFEDSTDQDWDEMWSANVMSGVRLSRHYFPIMLKKKYGRVVFISSESALQIPADVIHYGVSKTAQLAVARGMAELAVNTDVTVNSVLVGPTRSEGMGNILKQISEKDHLSESQIEKWFFESVRPTSLLKRFIRPDEIGSFVAFLASEEASSITGSALRADGGVVKSVI